MSSGAKILSGSKPDVIDCILIDYSAGGACLQLLKSVDLPGRFEILYGTTRKHCRVVWSCVLFFKSPATTERVNPPI